MLNSLLHQRLGRYSITALLGRGGMAAVYRARDATLQRDVALKVLYPQYTGEHTLVERFKREAITAAGLEHPHIVQVYDVGEQDDLLYIAMKLLSGYSLYDVLQARGALPLVELLPLLEQVASALDYAHRCGVVHRDIKPGNIILELPRTSAPIDLALAAMPSAGGRDDATVQGMVPVAAVSQPLQQIGALPSGTVAILTDFGIAKSLDTPGLTSTGALLGTPDYMAPEQIGSGRVDARADVYALGVLVYRALTGQRPFSGATQDVLLAHLHTMPDDPSLVNPHVPPALDPVILRALSKQPDARYSSAGEFVQALRAAWEGRSVIITGPIGEQTTRVTQPRPVPLPAPQTHTRTATPAPVRAMPRRRKNNALLFITVLSALLLIASGVLASKVGLFGGSGQVVAVPTTATEASGSLIGLVPSATRTASPEPATQAPTAPSMTQAENTPAPSAAPTEQPTATPVATQAPAPSQTARVIRQTVVVIQPSSTSRPTSVQSPPPPTLTASALPPTSLPPTDTPPTATVPPSTETTTPAPAACDESLLREGSGFTLLYENLAAVRGKIGCPAKPGGEQAIQGADQIFASGTMYWWRNQDIVYIMLEGESPNGRYSAFNKVAVAALPDPPTDIDPKMRAEGGFARVYYGVPEVQNAVGVPVTAERPISGAYQAFENGFMIYSPANGNVRGKTIYVLYNDGTFRRYDDLNPN